jgi:hypothetical protein
MKLQIRFAIIQFPAYPLKTNLSLVFYSVEIYCIDVPELMLTQILSLSLISILPISRMNINSHVCNSTYIVWHKTEEKKIGIKILSTNSHEYRIEEEKKNYENNLHTLSFAAFEHGQEEIYHQNRII